MTAVQPSTAVALAGACLRVRSPHPLFHPLKHNNSEAATVCRVQNVCPAAHASNGFGPRSFAALRSTFLRLSQVDGPAKHRTLAWRTFIHCLATLSSVHGADRLTVERLCPWGDRVRVENVVPGPHKSGKAFLAVAQDSNLDKAKPNKAAQA